VERHGRAEVEHWWWEVWNEPNIGYWRGTPAEFHRLHDHAVAAVRRALPTARVGGPDVAGSGGKFMRDFLEHCLRGTNDVTGQVGTPIDFISFHAKGAPISTNGHVRMGIANQLRTVDEGFRIIASYPELRGKPVVIGESDPEGCAACQGPQLGYRNGTMYSSYTAASFARIHDLADRRGINLAGALTWAFEFEDQAWFAGFRALASNGVDLPVLNVFRLFSKMDGQRLAVRSDGAVPLDAMLKEGVRARPDVSALASLGHDRLCLLLWHYHDDDLTGPDAQVTLALDGTPTAFRGGKVSRYDVDADHGNAFTAWQRMGAPAQPTAAQITALEHAATLTAVEGPVAAMAADGSLRLRLTVPRQAVSLLVLDAGTD
jgi:xylan 1,4-beta-xylosidase